MRLWLRSKLTLRAILLLLTPPRPSPSLRPARSSLGGRLQRTHTVACSDLRSTPTMAFTLLPEREGKVGGGGGGRGGAECSELEVGGGGRERGRRKKKKKQLDATCLEFELCCHVTARPKHTSSKKKIHEDGNLIPSLNLLMSTLPSWWNLFSAQPGTGSNI